jgi:hypothetical protein
MGKKKGKGHGDADLFKATEAELNKNYVSHAMKVKMETAEANLGYVSDEDDQHLKKKSKRNRNKGG